MSPSLRILGLLIAGLLALSRPEVAAANGERLQVTTPPPISGRQLSEPDSITSADVMARLLLAHQTLEQIRVHMGKPAPPEPLIEVRDVSAVEEYFAALNLHRRSLRFGFERLRTRQEWGAEPPLFPNKADAFEVIDGILKVALHVKESLGITSVAREQRQPESLTSADVFNQILKTGALLNLLLEKRTGPDDNYGILTHSLGNVLKLHSHFSRKLMPDEGALELNKTPNDVFVELKLTFEELQILGDLVGVSMLTLTSTGVSRGATPDDVSEIAVLIAAESGRLMLATKMTPTLDGAWTAGGKFPSHTLRRVKMLRQVLSETAEAVKQAQ